ncbi:MAG: arginine--tRNA ligase [Treponema sp.]|jgi:arginyl-tRNA synthetase|nr:arginine--tRNA ligase [Treponema sp.]
MSYYEAGNFQFPWKIQIADALNALIQEAGITADTVKPMQIIAETPPDPAMGDIGFPMFSYAKMLRKGPPQIAQMVCQRIKDRGLASEKPGAPGAPGAVEANGLIEAEGPYLNVRLNRAAAARIILTEVFSGDFGRPETLAGKKVMVEFSSPNTNKPLHLGHLRNDVLGESVSRIAAACGADLRKVCIINDRGIHICKSMLAYKEQGRGATPESENIKSDHFVGNWYVCFSRDLKKETEELMQSKGLKKEEAEARSPLLARAQDLLRRWEAEDAETTELWKQMNSWAVEGMKETYLRTGISFDQYYYESDTWQLGREEVLKGLERGIFYREADGAVAVDLSAEKLDKKILLRSDGTSIYITQDFGTAINRYKDFSFDQMIYVVGSEQQYHFKVLFVLLDKLGFPWAKNLHHLSYGMVNLPEGKMKSREGTVVDADDLIDSLRDMALAEIQEKEREEKVGDPLAVAENIALGALHYYLLQASPGKDMLFDPKESLSFNGNTGPYLQYMGARISSMLRKRELEAGNEELGMKSGNFSLLVSDPEWELLKTLAAYPQAVSEAADGLDPSRLAAYLYELSKAFSRFYHDCPILNAENPDLSDARLALSQAVLRVLKDAMRLTCIPFLEVM